MRYHFKLVTICILLVTSFLIVMPEKIEAKEVIEDTIILGPEEFVRHRINVTYNASILNGLSYFYEILDWGIDGHDMQFNIEYGKVENESLNYGGSHFNQQNGSGEIEGFDGDAYNFIWGNDNFDTDENFTLHYKIEYKYELIIQGSPSDDDDDDIAPDDDTSDDDDDGEESDGDSKSNGALIGGIVVGVIALVIIGLIVGIYFMKKK